MELFTAQLLDSKVWSRTVLELSFWIGGPVVEFQLCILWTLVRSLVKEITVYTADET